MRPAEADYPFAPLASRRAPRLFDTNGQPGQTREQRLLLRQCRREETNLRAAHRELIAAIESDDAELAVGACRRLLAVGLLLGDHARGFVA